MLTERQRKEFGAYLGRLRKASGKSLRQVKQETGISPGYLGLIENGERNPPQPEFLRKLAACYGVAAADLLREAGHLDPVGPPTASEEEADLRWAYDCVQRDPTYKSGHSLSGEVTPAVMRFVVELYEHYTGKRLLGRRRLNEEGERTE